MNPAAPTIVYTPKTIVGAVGQVITTLTPVITNGPVTVTISPALPTGLSIDPVTGAISGTPTATAALRSYTVTASNAGGSATDIITIVVTNPCPIAFNYSPASPTYTSGTAITALAPTISSGAPNTYAISPALSAGLAIDATNGVISGTPSALSLIHI